MSSINIEKELQSILDYEGECIHHNTFDNIVGLVRLYAESVIGEDETNTFEPFGDMYATVTDRNQLRAEQRARIK